MPAACSAAILFGRNPHQSDTFDVEADAAEALGVDTYQADLWALLSGDAARAVAAVPERGGLGLLYRGWMLTEEEYAAAKARSLQRVGD